MKNIIGFKLNSSIPSDAKFLFHDWIREDDLDQQKTLFFFYEVPIKKDCESEKQSQKRKDTDELINFVVMALNNITGKSFSAKTKKTRDLIRARINDGHSFPAFEAVIQKKASEWLTDPHMNQYLRPETLFGTKFESYLNQTTAQEMTQSAFDELEEHMK